MKAFVTSIGEGTTQLCVENLERFGFDVVLIEDERPLSHKLKDIYQQADSDFIRVDADVLVNQAVRHAQEPTEALWMQYMAFDLYSLRLSHGGVQRISASILPALRSEIDNFLHDDRPETRMWRLDEFSDRRLFVNSHEILGIHGFGVHDWRRVKAVKDGRKQYDYDWWLVERLARYYR